MATLLKELEDDLASRRAATFYLDQFDRAFNAFDEWHNRVNQTDAFWEGQWELVFPDDSITKEKPKAPNQVFLASLARMADAASVLPALRCDKSTERDKTRSELRERIAWNYLTVNEYPEMLHWHFLDRQLTGASFRLVIPGRDGFPRIVRKDPRHVYPNRLWSPDAPPSSYIVSYETPLGILEHEYPDQAEELASVLRIRHSDRKKQLVRVIESYDSSEMASVADVRTGATSRFGVVLDRVPNLINKVLIVCSARPSNRGKFFGAFEQVLGSQLAENRLFNYALDYGEDLVYRSSPVLSGIENPEDWGKGVVLRGKDGEQVIAERIAPAQLPPSFFELLSRAREAARTGANFPEGRSGSASQSIISAAGINALSAGYDGEVALEQRLEASALRRTLSLCFEVDEKYHDERKRIAGAMNSSDRSVLYTPSEDIRGDYDISVSYNAAEGVNAFNREIRVIQQFSNGLLDEETAMEHLAAVEDVQRVRNRKIRQQLRGTVLAMVQQQAVTLGNVQPLIEVAKILKENEDVDEKLMEIAQAAQLIPQANATPQAAQQAPQSPTGSFEEASGLSRGLQGAGTNVPGMAALPPLEDIL